MSDPGSKADVTRVVTVPVLAALLIALAVGLAPNASTRLVQVGEGLWPGYGASLRSDPVAPDCDLAELDARLAACPAEGAAPAPAPVGDPFGGQDPFADPAPTDPFGGEDPFADPAPAPTPDPFGGEDPFAEPAPSDDPFGGEDPFADPAPAAPTENCPALRSLRAQCEEQHAGYDEAVGRVTSSVRAFRAFDQRIGALARFPWFDHLLVLLVLLGSFSTTVRGVHVALRDPRGPAEHAAAHGSQLLSHLILAASAAYHFQVQRASTAEKESPEIALMWAVGFVVLAGVNVAALVRGTDRREATSPARLAMVVPLYAWMVVIAGVWFFGVEQHFAGPSIYLSKFLGTSSIYLGIGLYIWAGMMLAQTSVATRAFAVLDPFRLPPAVLAWVVVVLSAVPTAYTGASGIFVIAAGAVIFERLRAAGTPRRLALAATAMSGSLGVVLRPCLVVVLVAVLNKQVTTNELFGWGKWVFALTAALSLVAFALRNQSGWRFAPLGDALPAAGSALGRLLPHVAVGVGVLLAFLVGLGMGLNEFTAPYLLPVVLLAVVLFDLRGSSWHGLHVATEESGHNVGALLVLMAASVGLGGVIERAEVLSLVPESLGSPFTAMLVLVVILVVVGMTMDALGAVILVTVTAAQIAYRNGIDPVHFWMTVLVAFELGYLSPPVAINHLLARQVIGREAYVEDDPVDGFFAAYEHQILPMAVMGTALLLVAFVPLLFY